MEDIYFCDLCCIDKVDVDKEELVKTYFSCYPSLKYLKHVKTTKHLENKKNIEEDSESILCKYCNKKYSKEGYEVHKKRNEMWWKLGKIGNISCNNFVKGKQRVSSFAELTKEKPKQHRTKVGSFSPITQSYRPPNNFYKEKEKLLIECNYCNGALFTSQYDTKFLTKHETFICTCSDEKQMEQETKYKKKEKEELSWVTKGDITPSNDDEVDYTEKPQLDEYCNSCGLGINYTYPIKIIEKWDIKHCECPDSDDTDSE